MSASAWYVGKVQEAARDFLRAQVWAWIESSNIVAGIHRPTRSSDDLEQEVRTYPGIVCLCQEAEAVALHSGTWSAELTITLEMDASDTDHNTFHTRCEEVMNAVCTTTIAADLSAALADFYVEQVNVSKQGWSVEDNKWQALITVQVIGCGQDIT